MAFEIFMISDTATNLVEDGEITGVRIPVRISYYRGVVVSLLEGIEVAIDDERFSREQIRFALRETVFTLDELAGDGETRWEFGEWAEVLVTKEGGLPQGEHEIHMVQQFRISYLPWPLRAESTRCVQLIDRELSPAPQGVGRVQVYDARPPAGGEDEPVRVKSLDKPGIKRGVSLYSYQQAYFRGQLTLEQCIAEAAKIGAVGIESFAEQMMPGFPDLSDGFYRQWRDWMVQYGTYATSHVMMLEVKRWPDRLLDADEQLENMRRDIRHAARLGCEVVRVQVFTPTGTVERSIPIAAEHGVKLAVEIHTPYHLHEASIVEKYEMFQRHGPEWVGFIPDMAGYVKRFPRVIADRYIRNGADAEIVKFIADTYDEAYASATDQVDLSHLPGEVESRGGGDAELMIARTVARFYHYNDPRHMLEFMPYIHHVHAKFYEMTEDRVEYSIPYDEIVSVLAAGGYRGHLSSEYEGQRWTEDIHPGDEIEQVGRQHAMFERLLEPLQDTVPA